MSTFIKKKQKQQPQNKLMTCLLFGWFIYLQMTQVIWL